LEDHAVEIERLAHDEHPGRHLSEHAEPGMLLSRQRRQPAPKREARILEQQPLDVHHVHPRYHPPITTHPQLHHEIAPLCVAVYADRFSSGHRVTEGDVEHGVTKAAVAQLPEEPEALE